MVKDKFDIAKECYEKRYNTQKYEKSTLHNTYGRVVSDIINKTRKEVFEDIEDISVMTDDGYETEEYKKLKTKHLGNKKKD